MATTIRLGVILLQARDFPAMVRFYEEVLGLPKRQDLYRDGIRDRPDNWATFRAGDLDIEMFAPAPNTPPERMRAGSVRLAFKVDDLAAAVATFSARGGRLKRGIARDWWGQDAWFLDPDGNELQLYQPDDGVA